MSLRPKEGDGILVAELFQNQGSDKPAPVSSLGTEDQNCLS